jgi:hypothetical protein
MVLTALGCALAAAGVFFAFGGKAISQAGGGAFKSISLQGPAWLVLVAMGSGLVGYGQWLESQGTEKTEPPPSAPTTVPFEDFGEPWTFGDDEYLDALWIECEYGNWLSCDDLYLQSPVDSDYEWFGTTCGNLIADPVDFCDISNQEGTYEDDPDNCGNAIAPDDRRDCRVGG